MQTSNRLFDDLAKVASGAASTLAGVRQEIDSMVRQRIERLMSDFDLPTRDELEAVKAVAANARAGQEALERRVAELEAHVAGKTGGAETGTVSAPGPTGLGPDEVGGAGTEAAGPGAEANTPDGPAEARPAPAPSDPTSTSTKD